MAHGLDVSLHPDEETGNRPEWLLICCEKERAALWSPQFPEALMMAGLQLCTKHRLNMRRKWESTRDSSDLLRSYKQSCRDLTHLFSVVEANMVNNLWIVLISENPWNIYWTFHPLLGDTFIKCSFLQPREIRGKIILHWCKQIQILLDKNYRFWTRFDIFNCYVFINLCGQNSVRFVA